jgi:hypothetical protein
MHPQQIIIVVCACLAMMFSVVSRRVVGNGGRWTLLLAAFGLFAVAGYESYMTLVWEKTVSAAIRLDILVIDFPIMFISIIAGVLAWSKKPVNPQKQRKDEGCKDKLEE